MIENKEFEIRRAEWLRQYKEDQMKKLDEQGRHRSEWAYAPYDGRKEEVDMWPHFCTMENVDMYVGKGEECNWCGEKEKESEIR